MFHSLKKAKLACTIMRNVWNYVKTKKRYHSMIFVSNQNPQVPVYDLPLLLKVQFPILQIQAWQLIGNSLNSESITDIIFPMSVISIFFPWVLSLLNLLCHCLFMCCYLKNIYFYMCSHMGSFSFEKYSSFYSWAYFQKKNLVSDIWKKQ